MVTCTLRERLRTFPYLELGTQGATITSFSELSSTLCAKKRLRVAGFDLSAQTLSPLSPVNLETQIFSPETSKPSNLGSSAGALKSIKYLRTGTSIRAIRAKFLKFLKVPPRTPPPKKKKKPSAPNLGALLRNPEPTINLGASENRGP